jgi:hypothetical protein
VNPSANTAETVMFDAIFVVLASIGELLFYLYEADNRPSTRKFTFGCSMVVALVAVVAAIVWLFE